MEVALGLSPDLLDQFEQFEEVLFENALSLLAGGKELEEELVVSVDIDSEAEFQQLLDEDLEGCPEVGVPGFEQTHQHLHPIGLQVLVSNGHDGQLEEGFRVASEEILGFLQHPADQFQDLVFALGVQGGEKGGQSRKKLVDEKTKLFFLEKGVKLR